MQIEVNLRLTVDEGANFLEVDDTDTLHVMRDFIKEAFYVMDDIKLTYIDLEMLRD